MVMAAPEKVTTEDGEETEEPLYADEEVDLEALAEEVYAVLREYLLLEQERGGWWKGV